MKSILLIRHKHDTMHNVLLTHVFLLFSLDKRIRHHCRAQGITCLNNNGNPLKNLKLLLLIRLPSPFF